MKKGELVRIGRIQKTFGTAGELILDIIDIDIKIETGVAVFLDLSGTQVPFFISAIKDRQDGRYQISLEDIDNPDEAVKLVNSTAFLEKKYIPAAKEGQMLITELIGFTVYDEVHGLLGVLQDILEYPEQDMMQILLDEKEILIPLIEEYIVNIDPDTQQIAISTPEGLLDILRGDE